MLALFQRKARDFNQCRVALCNLDRWRCRESSEGSRGFDQWGLLRFDRGLSWFRSMGVAEVRARALVASAVIATCQNGVFLSLTNRSTGAAAAFLSIHFGKAAAQSTHSLG